MEKPLSGIRVIELADYVSAPVCCRLLADMGAEVVKVERPSGNVWRVSGQGALPERFTPEENPVYDIYNTGKKHIVLDLKTEAGMEICRRLLREADVFVTNNRPAALKRLGLDYESIKNEYPRLIYAIGLGYGEKGPDAESPAYDTSAFWSRTGFLRDMAVKMDGYMPVAPPSSMGDTVTGITMAMEACAALLSRQKTGRGECVRSSLFHNAIFVMGTMQIMTQRPFGTTFPKTRAEHGDPNGFFRCKDGEYVFISAGYAPHLVPRVMKMIQMEDLLEDPRFSTIEARNENAEEYYRLLSECFLTKTVDEWLVLGKVYDIPISRMQHFADLSEDPQALANGYIEHVQFANGHVDAMASSPVEMESVGQLKTVPCHAIGQDTADVLRQYGYTDGEIDAMRAEGAIN